MKHEENKDEASKVKVFKVEEAKAKEISSFDVNKGEGKDKEKDPQEMRGDP